MTQVSQGSKHRWRIHTAASAGMPAPRKASLRSGSESTVSVCCPSDHDGPRATVNRALRAGALRKNFDRPAAQETPAQTCFLYAPVNPVDSTSQSVRQSTACQQAKTTMRGAVGVTQRGGVL